VPIDDVLKRLNNYLNKGERKKKAHCERIDTLLNKLKEKEDSLEKKLLDEKDPDKRKRIKIELKVVTAQRKKGQKRRKELNAKCK
jgi:Skp family chaperone for outer membrane proteins